VAGDFDYESQGAATRLIAGPILRSLTWSIGRWVVPAESLERRIGGFPDGLPRLDLVRPPNITGRERAEIAAQPDECREYALAIPVRCSVLASWIQRSWVGRIGPDVGL